MKEYLKFLRVNNFRDHTMDIMMQPAKGVPDLMDSLSLSLSLSHSLSLSLYHTHAQTGQTRAAHTTALSRLQGQGLVVLTFQQIRFRQMTFWASPLTLTCQTQ